ncbi:MAG: hypothetical protein GWO24_00595, partial [Akkermansiaceae bacterium]|nr:hypothetical protein [Akkermansiaceae bacterium]
MDGVAQWISDRFDHGGRSTHLPDPRLHPIPVVDPSSLTNTHQDRRSATRKRSLVRALRNGVALVSLFLAQAGQARAEVRLPAVIGNHMVLQRDQPAPIWGWAAPGEAVAVTLDSHTVKTTTTRDGRWMIRLPAMKAGGPHVMTVTGSANTITVKDILIGELWVCSGQSNMEWRV